MIRVRTDQTILRSQLKVKDYEVGPFKILQKVNVQSIS